MSLLSYNQLCELVDQGVLQGAQYENINSASIDLVLGETIMVENQTEGVINMLDKNAGHLETIVMSSEGYVVPPGGVVLAQSREIFNLPNNISAEFKLKSTQARNFFNHCTAGWCDAGWHGSVLTLEFINHLQHHSIRIKPGMKCGQIVFFSHEEVPAGRSYAVRGQYNGDKGVTAGKGLK